MGGCLTRSGTSADLRVWSCDLALLDFSCGSVSAFGTSFLASFVDFFEVFLHPFSSETKTDKQKKRKESKKKQQQRNMLVTSAKHAPVYSSRFNVQSSHIVHKF